MMTMTTMMMMMMMMMMLTLMLVVMVAVVVGEALMVTKAIVATIATQDHQGTNRPQAFSKINQSRLLIFKCANIIKLYV